MMQNLNDLVLDTNNAITHWLWPFVLGIVLGMIFFIGLWWTVNRLFRVKQPAFWFLAGFTLRMGAVVYGMYWVSNGQWQSVLAYALGIVLARFIILWLTDFLPSVIPEQAISTKGLTPRKNDRAAADSSNAP